MITIHKPEWALVAYVRSRGAQTDQEQLADLAVLTRELQRDQQTQRKLISIIDVRVARPPTPSQRRLVADWIKANTDAMTRSSRGIVFVMDGAIARGILTALLWMSRLPVPHEVTSELDDAVRWTVTRLEETGAPVPSRLRNELGRALAPHAHEAVDVGDDNASS